MREFSQRLPFREGLQNMRGVQTFGVRSYGPTLSYHQFSRQKFGRGFLNFLFDALNCILSVGKICAKIIKRNSYF